MTTSWYSISISLQSVVGEIFSGYFSVDNTTNLITAFYYENNFQENILGPINANYPSWLPGNYYFPPSPPYTFTLDGVNITSFPYYSNQGNTSQYYNLGLNSQVWLSTPYSNNEYEAVIMNFAPISNPISNICFPAGTPITCNQGNIPIEKINPDIHTIRNKKIVGISKTITQDKYLICFEKNALEKNIPSQKTIISENHCIFYNGNMREAKQFVGINDRVYKIQYRGEVLYNVLMEYHDIMFVNNLICETLHPENGIGKLYRYLQNLNPEEQNDIINNYNEYVIKNKTFTSRSKNNSGFYTFLHFKHRFYRIK